MSARNWWLPTVVAACALTAVSLMQGCADSQSDNTMDAINASMGLGGAAYLEAFIEYPGPQEKWAGPTSFMIHVNAKNSGRALITATPDLFRETSMRKLASAGKEMTAEEARAQLGLLATAMQAGDPPFQGCMSPVRVRMIRADGIIAEKQGCRSATGWPHAVSDAVGRFLAAAR